MIWLIWLMWTMNSNQIKSWCVSVSVRHAFYFSLVRQCQWKVKVKVKVLTWTLKICEIIKILKSAIKCNKNVYFIIKVSKLKKVQNDWKALAKKIFSGGILYIYSLYDMTDVNHEPWTRIKSWCGSVSDSVRHAF